MKRMPGESDRKLASIGSQDSETTPYQATTFSVALSSLLINGRCRSRPKLFGRLDLPTLKYQVAFIAHPASIIEIGWDLLIALGGSLFVFGSNDSNIRDCTFCF
jgi:hypothetical protein